MNQFDEVSEFAVIDELMLVLNRPNVRDNLLHGICVPMDEAIRRYEEYCEIVLCDLVDAAKIQRAVCTAHHMSRPEERSA